MGLADIVWNAFTRSQDRRPHVQVEIKNGFFTYGPHLGEPLVIIKVISHTDHPIRATSAAIRAESLSDGFAWDAYPVPQSQIPGVIPPYDAAEVYMPASGLKQVGVDLTRPIRGGVQLASGQMVWSRPRTLWREDLLAA